MEGHFAFNLSDGLTPQVVDKLNHNFGILDIGAKSDDGMGDISRLREETDEASSLAAEAQMYADQARQSAVNANYSATNALLSLSDVQNIVGTLDWIATHGTFTPTTDTELEDKVYYTWAGDRYIPVADPVPERLEDTYILTTDGERIDGKEYYARNESYTYTLNEQEYDDSAEYFQKLSAYELAESDYTGQLYDKVETFVEYDRSQGLQPGIDYYVLVDGEYVYVDDPLEDDVVYVKQISYDEISTWYDGCYKFAEWYEPVLVVDEDLVNTYYVRTDESTYTLDTGTGSPEGLYESLGKYCELTIGESLQQYVASHLALDGDGLWVLNDYESYKLLVAANGIQIRDEENGEVAYYGDEIRLGKPTEVHLLITNDGISFLDNQGSELMYMRDVSVTDVPDFQLFIPKAQITDELQFGNYVWKPRNDGANITLRYVGD